MNSPNKGGRPLKEAGNPRDRRLDIRVTEAELEEIKLIAKDYKSVTECILTGVRVLKKDSTE